MAGLFDCTVCSDPSAFVLEEYKQFVGSSAWEALAGYCKTHAPAAKGGTRLTDIKEYEPQGTAPSSESDEIEADSDD